MAPRHEHSSLYQRAFLPRIPRSWPLLALCSAASSFIGLVFFTVGLIGVISRSEESKVRDWIFLSFGIAMLAIGLSLLLLSHIRATAVRASSSSPRRTHRNATRPVNRQDPLPVWSVDAIDPTFRPPPAYYDALQCAPSSVVLTRSTALGARPPPYTPSPLRQSRTTDV
uniref:Uncharacterized protein n=1 Tax=Parascaris univalens TaxID=6257 RepID=A0A915AI46_PARUN